VTMTTAGGRTGEVAAAAGLLIATAALCYALAVRSIYPAGPLVGDEGFHAMWAARIAADAQAGQPLSLAYDSYRQVYWPPGFAWLMGAVLLVANPSDAAARMVGLLGLTGLALALYWGGRALAPTERSAAVVGLIAAAAGVTAGGILEIAPRAMLDVPAAALLACGFALYLHLLRRPRTSPVGWSLLGGLIVATFLFKQNYGVLLGLALAAAFVLDGQWYRRHPNSEAAAFRRSHMNTAAVMAVLLAIWFGYPQKIMQTLQSLRNSPWGPDRSSLEGVLFYPCQSKWLAGSWLLLATWLAAVAASSTKSCLRDARIRMLLIFIVLQVALAEWSVTKIPRHIMPLVPAFAMLTAYQAGRLLQARSRFVSVGAASVVALVLTAHIVAAVQSLGPVADHAGSQLLQVLAAESRRGDRVLLIGSIDLPATPAAIDWRLLGERAITVDGAGSLVTASEQRFSERLLPKLPAVLQSRLQRLVDRWPASSGNTSLYVGWPLEPSLQLRAGNFQETVRRIVSARRIDRVVWASAPIDSRQTGVTSGLATRQLSALGFQPDPSPIAVEGVLVHVFRRTLAR
jgi:hypothetical protein